MCNVWKIYNINTPNKGILLKDKFSIPLNSFLQRVVDRAECWRAIPEKRGRLSPQIFTSFCHLYCTPVYCKPSHWKLWLLVRSFFVLQNDPLEHHFGLYRMMHNTTIAIARHLKQNGD